MSPARMEKIKNTLQPKDWVEKYSDQLFKYAVIRVSNEETARDMVQDTFLSALKNAETFRGEISEKNWLYMILKNKIIDHFRSKASEAGETIHELSLQDTTFFDEQGKWKKSKRPSRQSEAVEFETKEFYQVLEKCKQKLPELQNAVFTLKYLDQKDSDEICKELRISSSNYWVLMHRAKLQLRDCLQKNWFVK